MSCSPLNKAGWAELVGLTSRGRPWLQNAPIWRALRVPECRSAGLRLQEAGRNKEGRNKVGQKTKSAANKARNKVGATKSAATKSAAIKSAARQGRISATKNKPVSKSPVSITDGPFVLSLTISHPRSVASSRIYNFMASATGTRNGTIQFLCHSYR